MLEPTPPRANNPTRQGPRRLSQRARAPSRFSCPRCYREVDELVPSELLDLKTLSELRVCSDCRDRASDEPWRCDECDAEDIPLLFDLQFIVGDDEVRRRFVCEPCATALFELERRYLYGPEDPDSSCHACGRFLEERRVWSVTLNAIHSYAARARIDSTLPEALMAEAVHG